MSQFLNTSFNFLPYIDLTYNLCKNIKLYDHASHPDSVGADQSYGWPGQRSDNLIKESPFLYLLVLHQAENKLGLIKKNYSDISGYIHVRDDKDNKNDSIHKDGCHTLILFLSETNYKSGTTLYSEKDIPLADISFQQNTAIFFDGNIKHKSKLNYGDTIDNARMTVNFFCWPK